MSSPRKSLTAIGMMTGTSFDGIDASIIQTDGSNIEKIGVNKSLYYDDKFRKKIRLLLSKKLDPELLLSVHNELATLHANLVKDLLLDGNLGSHNIDIIGFHGQTIYHDPNKGHSLQIGNAALLAQMTQINVISDFRSKDIANKGQGAPLVPIFHKALCKKLDKPVVVLNIGGVSNITYIEDDYMLAFDTGPGGAMLDDFIYKHISKKFDDRGVFASQGTPDKGLLKILLQNDYFKLHPPKSLDRNAFHSAMREISKLSPKDAAATLTYFIASSIHDALKFLPKTPKHWFVCGGGRHNEFLLEIMKKEYNLNVILIDKIELSLPNKKFVNGDFIESQAFGFLAVRSFYNLPITWPSTTGVLSEVSGGAFYRF